MPEAERRCKTCRLRMLYQYELKNVPPEQRTGPRRIVRQAGRGLCTACYAKAKKDGTLIDHERRTFSSEEFMHEVEAIGIIAGEPIAPQLRLIAGRLGMTYAAASMAWTRVQRRRAAA